MGLLRRLERLGARTHDSQSGGHHQPLLGAGNAKVHAPIAEAQLDASQGAHRIHVEEGGVLRFIHRAPHPCDIARDAGGGLVVNDHDALDAMLTVVAKRLLDLVLRRAGSPLAFDHLNFQPEPLHHVDPQVAELAEARREYAVAGRKCVAERGFPSARARRREDERFALLAQEKLLKAVEQRPREVGEPRRPVILHRDHHRALDPIGDIGGPGNEEEIAAGHESLLGVSQRAAAGTGRVG